MMAPTTSKYFNSVYAPTYQDQWEEYFKQLVAYKNLNGHCNVNTKRSSLGRWCSRQRLRYRGGKLYPEQEQRLRELGFEFKPQNHRGPGRALKERWPDHMSAAHPAESEKRALEEQ